MDWHPLSFAVRALRRHRYPTGSSIRAQIMSSFMLTAFWYLGIAAKRPGANTYVKNSRWTYQQTTVSLADKELLRGKPQQMIINSLSVRYFGYFLKALTHSNGEGGFKRHLCQVQPYLQQHFGLRGLFLHGKITDANFSGYKSDDTFITKLWLKHETWSPQHKSGVERETFCFG